MQRFIVPVVIVAALAILAAIVSGAPPAEAQGRPPATTNIQIVNGHNPGEVIISWDAVPAATHYRIGYVNMATDHPLAKSTEGGRTGNWLEAFVYVDVEAQNFVTSGTVYTIRRLEQGVRHAFVVLTNGSAYGEPTWPTTSPRWKFLVVTDQGGACPTAPPTTTVPPVTTPSTPLTNAELALRVRPALVQIIVTDSDGDTSSGTGFVVRSNGLVVTNRHVVDDAETVTARMNTSDGQRLELTGRVLGRGILADLAVIQLDSNRTFATLPLGDSDAVAQGDEITAWGYPLSSFLGTDPTLTKGIISSTNRIFEDTDYLQTNAAIAPGNSGGPVVDRFGRVVGVNTAGLVQIQEDGTRVPVPGIYLAIASNEVSSRLNTMAAGGPTQATYRNLRFDYGYSMDIPKGWYLYRERETYSEFLPYATNRYVDIAKFTFIEPHSTRSSDLSLLANRYWNVLLPEFAAENWAFFQPISITRVTVGGQESYRLEYRRRIGAEFCITNVVAIVSISSSFPNKPYGFVTSSVICENHVATHSAERETMLNSFRP